MKIKNIILAFVATATLALAGCGKDIDLQGTSWECAKTVDMTEMFLEEDEDGTAAQLIQMLGGKFLFDVNMTLDFTTADAGSVTMYIGPSASMTIPDAIKPLMSQLEQTATDAMTYTFDGEKGTITSDGESQSFSYNSSDKTISMTFTGQDAADIAEIFGSSTLVFKQIK